MNESSPLPQDVELLVHSVLDQETIVAITDKRGLIAYANDRFCEISGYSRSELLGQNHRLLRSGIHPPEFYQKLWRTILQGNTWKGEICNRAKDGHLYWVDTTISPLRQQGLITHFVALRSDVTAKKEAEASLLEKRKHEEEERRMLALGHLADGVLHDLNNILTGVLGLIAEESSEVRNEMLQTAVGKMVQLTRTLRDYSSGRPSESVRFRLNPMISCASSLVRFRKGVPKCLSVEEEIDATNGCEVDGNEAQVFEVLLNLAVNAVEAAIDSPLPRVVLSSRLNGKMATIIIEDNGRGVPDSIVATLFEPRTSTKGEGRGVGLSVAKRIALAHGGDLRLVKSGPDGSGARFELDLPVQEVVMPKRALRILPTMKPRRCILVSDDDANVRRMVENVANEIGLDVLYPTEAIDLITTAGTMQDILAAAVIDCCDLDSDQCAVARLRKIKPGLPILLISATLSCSGRHPSAWGFVEELPKPFNARELSFTLNHITAGSS